MKKNADRFVHAIFCDDIRHETGDKLSFMGCYQGELYVPFFPVMLPKLCVFVTVVTPVARPFKALAIRVEQGGKTIYSIEISIKDLARARPPADNDVTRQLVNSGIAMAPFVITEPGEIRVVVTTEEGEILGPRLRIRVTPQTEVAADVAANTSTAKAKPKAAAKKAAVKRAPVEGA